MPTVATATVRPIMFSDPPLNLYFWFPVFYMPPNFANGYVGRRVDDVPTTTYVGHHRDDHDEYHTDVSTRRNTICLAAKRRRVIPTVVQPTTPVP
jgi:hypothetical protein